MKKLTFNTLALAALWAGALLPQSLAAQNITGAWQGTIKAGPQDVRVVFSVSTEDDKLKAVLHLVDQAAAPAIPATAITRDGSTVKISIAAIAGGYEGKLGPDGNSMNGTWTAAAGALPLNLVRATPETAWTIPEPPPPVVPMAANANPAFEVATIKPGSPEIQGKLITMRGKQVLSINNTLSDLIVFAFGVHAKQIVGAPSWSETDKYDVTGEPDTKGQPSLDQLRVMYQKLLKDRFQLTFHRDKRELSVYALVVAKNGHKLTQSTAATGATPSLAFPKLGLLPARNATMADFASVMQMSVLDKPVVDQTGLAGRWDFTLKWTPDATQFIGLGGGTAPPPDPDAPPDLYAAIQQQLGLKLDSVKAPTEVFVIDKVEKPSDN